MQPNSSTFHIPLLNNESQPNYEVADDFAEIYQELTEISEEIERCRSRNS